MSKATKWIWRISEDWCVSRDSYNWVLLKRTGKYWKKSYYPSFEQLIESFYQKLCLSSRESQQFFEQFKIYLEARDEFLEALSSEVKHILSVRPKTPSKTHVGSQTTHLSELEAGK